MDYQQNSSQMVHESIPRPVPVLGGGGGEYSKWPKSLNQRRRKKRNAATQRGSAIDANLSHVSVRVGNHTIAAQCMVEGLRQRLLEQIKDCCYHLSREEEKKIDTEGVIVCKIDSSTRWSVPDALYGTKRISRRERGRVRGAQKSQRATKRGPEIQHRYHSWDSSAMLGDVDQHVPDAHLTAHRDVADCRSTVRVDRSTRDTDQERIRVGRHRAFRLLNNMRKTHSACWRLSSFERLQRHPDRTPCHHLKKV